MNTYKVDLDKGFKILTAVTPNLVFINGIRFSDYTVLADKFKSVDCNLLILDNLYVRFATRLGMTREQIALYFANDVSGFSETETKTPTNRPDVENALIATLHEYMDKFRTTPCILAGNIANVQVLKRIFDDDHAIFTYVYVYPNSEEHYLSVVDKYISTAENDIDPDLQNLINLRKAPQDDPKTDSKKDKKKSSKKETLKETPKDSKKETPDDAKKNYVKKMFALRKKIFKSHNESFNCLVILDIK